MEDKEEEERGKRCEGDRGCLSHSVRVMVEILNFV